MTENLTSGPTVHELDVQDTDQSVSAEQEKPLSKREERELKLAYARALEQRKQVIKRNKELIADKELEVAYWKAEADLLRYRFEKMDFYLKNLDIEPKYLQATEEQRLKQAAQLETEGKQTN